MGCCLYVEPVDGGADTFTVEMPRLTVGRGALEFAEVDAGRLAQSAVRQSGAIANAPREASPADVADIFRAAVSYW